MATETGPLLTAAMSWGSELVEPRGQGLVAGFHAGFHDLVCRKLETIDGASSSKATPDTGSNDMLTATDEQILVSALCSLRNSPLASRNGSTANSLAGSLAVSQSSSPLQPSQQRSANVAPALSIFAPLPANNSADGSSKIFLPTFRTPPVTPGSSLLRPRPQQSQLQESQHKATHHSHSRNAKVAQGSSGTQGAFTGPCKHDVRILRSLRSNQALKHTNDAAVHVSGIVTTSSPKDSEGQGRNEDAGAQLELLSSSSF